MSLDDDVVCRNASLELFDGTSGSSSYVNGEYACTRTWTIIIRVITIKTCSLSLVYTHSFVDGL